MTGHTRSVDYSSFRDMQGLGCSDILTQALELHRVLWYKGRSLPRPFWGTCLRTDAYMQIIVYVCIIYNISIDKDFGKYLHIHAYIPPYVISLFVSS